MVIMVRGVRSCDMDVDVFFRTQFARMVMLEQGYQDTLDCNRRRYQELIATKAPQEVFDRMHTDLVPAIKEPVGTLTQAMADIRDGCYIPGPSNVPYPVWRAQQLSRAQQLTEVKSATVKFCPDCGAELGSRRRYCDACAGKRRMATFHKSRKPSDPGFDPKGR